MKGTKCIIPEPPMKDQEGNSMLHFVFIVILSHFSFLCFSMLFAVWSPNFKGNVGACRRSLNTARGSRNGGWMEILPTFGTKKLCRVFRPPGRANTGYTNAMVYGREQNNLSQRSIECLNKADFLLSSEIWDQLWMTQFMLDRHNLWASRH